VRVRETEHEGERKKNEGESNENEVKKRKRKNLNGKDHRYLYLASDLNTSHEHLFKKKKKRKEKRNRCASMQNKANTHKSFYLTLAKDNIDLKKGPSDPSANFVQSFHFLLETSVAEKVPSKLEPWRFLLFPSSSSFSCFCKNPRREASAIGMTTSILFFFSKCQKEKELAKGRANEVPS